MVNDCLEIFLDFISTRKPLGMPSWSCKKSIPEYGFCHQFIKLFLKKSFRNILTKFFMKILKHPFSVILLNVSPVSFTTRLWMIFAEEFKIKFLGKLFEGIYRWISSRIWQNQWYSGGDARENFELLKGNFFSCIRNKNKTQMEWLSSRRNSRWKFE